jgi:hypothetical protein
MSSGPYYPGICLTAHEFQPINPKFLALDYIEPSTRGTDQHQKYTPSYAPPIGLYGISQDKLRQVCLKHIKAIIEQERHDGEYTQGDISEVSWKTFEAVNRYRKASPGNGNVS